MPGKQAKVQPKVSNRTLFSVISASSVGTLIEWYDFYIFGSLAAILSSQFFPKDNPTAALLSTLATFAAGFVVRPFGALVFGRLGDLVGRKYTFLVTLVLMGGSTFAIGLIPGYATIGFWAPLLVLLLRLIQGLALGGEYGGAATYVAEYAPEGRRGYFTSFIQTTATLGLFVSLGVILITRESLGVDKFSEWGWRVPFLLSILLVGVSIVIRLRMAESPLFSKLKSEGNLSKNPLAESFGKKQNLKMVLLALFGATAGQGVIWYTGQFYALSFIQKACNIEFVQSNIIVAVALLAATPFFVIFGGLSDRIGRKSIMLTGMLLGILTYRPIYDKLYSLADLTTKKEFVDARTIDRKLAKQTNGDLLTTTTTTHFFADGLVAKDIEKTVTSTTNPSAKPELTKAVTLPTKSFWIMILLVFLQVIYVTMVYGPVAAFLVELFPTRIRYTSMSLPYHIGNGIFGGLTPFIATALVATATKANEVAPNSVDKPYLEGLWYPILVAGVCFVIGLLYLNNKSESAKE
ncbi:MFS transporter [Spirosoma endophyticum]|uniref:MFS transporter, MHS family, proline/betaine transporter n=1 Tax=Spirosoma endophyticum TaxID=662367 RepID=A0A1I1MLH7_9BACT|nr:MFS transporter [Spirosoma endophyticum]SFC86221.1 MFS transporter, MHS family, proline/betaine transporter [Spirosoma endophyticum]